MGLVEVLELEMSLCPPMGPHLKKRDVTFDVELCMNGGVAFPGRTRIDPVVSLQIILPRLHGSTRRPRLEGGR